MCVEEELRCSSSSCASMRFDAIDARQLLCRLFPMSIVTSWHVMRAKIFGSDLAGPATMEHVSIRGPSHSSSRSRSQSTKRVVILAGLVRDRDRAAAGKEEGRAGSTRAAGVQRSSPRFLGRARTVGGKEIPLVASVRGEWWSRRGSCVSIRNGGAREVRRCERR
jgi:hypothetical protein